MRRLDVRDQPFHQLAVLDDRAEPHEAVARVFVLRDSEQCLAERRIGCKLFRSVDQPEIELVVEAVTRLVRVMLFEIVDEISRMHFEDPREHETRAARQMRTRAALELREIRLTDLPSQD